MSTETVTPERLAKALGWAPCPSSPECNKRHGELPAIGWAIVPEVIAAIEAEAWEWMRFRDGEVGIDAVDGTQLSGARAPDFPTALITAFLMAKEASGSTGRVEFEVFGNPVTQGSIRATIHSRTGRAIAIPDHRKQLMDWRADIKAAALLAKGDWYAEKGVPVFVVATFRLPRPKSLPKNVLYPTKKPDIDKLTRSLLDALSGTLYADDSQVVSMVIAKRYESATPGVSVQVYTV
jgi:crossover junction endodeoxyribonuclease RusA